MNTNEVLRITCEELKPMMDRGEPVVVIDTRKTSEYNTDHIKGSINIYYNPSGESMERSLMLSALPLEALLVPYCDCDDDSTSAVMAIELLDLRYEADMVKALKGGLPRWRELGYPMETG
jgi:rhodanese-related sulfurtransferase